MDYVLIVFTWMAHVPAKQTELPMKSMRQCERFIKKHTPSFEEVEGLHYSFTCEKVERYE